MYVRIHAIPGAKKERITKKQAHVYEVLVREPAERNLANKRIREIIANEYGVSTKAVKLLTGHRSATKMLSIDN